jgi:hypothetical protein
LVSCGPIANRRKTARVNNPLLDTVPMSLSFPEIGE